MERTQIYLNETEKEALEREARTTGRSKSQLIRDAIVRVYLQQDRGELLRAIEGSFGAWRGRREGGAAWVERRRAGRLARLQGDR